jgi:hypothetical protein
MTLTFDDLATSERNALKDAQNNGYLTLPRYFFKSLVETYCNNCVQQRRSGVILSPASRGVCSLRIFAWNLDAFYRLLSRAEKEPIKVLAADPILGWIDMSAEANYSETLAKLCWQLGVEATAPNWYRLLESANDPLSVLRSFLHWLPASERYWGLLKMLDAGAIQCRAWIDRRKAFMASEVPANVDDYIATVKDRVDKALLELFVARTVFFYIGDSHGRPDVVFTHQAYLDGFERFCR